jgi:UDP-N-acetylmuramate dehydrogenase
MIAHDIFIEENHSLLSANTLRIDVTARYFCKITEPEQIPQALAFSLRHNLPVLVLGGGSNIVLTGDFSGLVLSIALSGIAISQRADEVMVTAAAGENWQQLVRYCLQQGYTGLENLSLIPGTVGAAPVQNIGAYGVELEQIFVSLNGWDIEQQRWRTLTRADCCFGYRDSIFKQSLKDRFIITSVTLSLSSRSKVNTSYAALDQFFKQAGIDFPTPQQVADAVTRLRQSKLPDPLQLANVGSFFKNPVVTDSHCAQLLEQFPQLVFYPYDANHVKLAAAWLVEKAGWKGRRLGPVGMHDQQSIVLINYSHGSGQDVLALARQIQQDVAREFSVELEIEPRIY